VAVQDDLAFAGAHKYYSHSAIDGAVYVYRFNGAAWNPGVRITASDAGLESGWLGFAVDVCGDYLLVGAPSARTSNGDQSGAAYIFRGVITDCNSDGISDLLNIAECFSGDCNRNSVPDECDLASGDSLDQNGNSRPDECEVGDLNCDGITGFADINPFVLILANRELWQQAYPSCLWSFGDINSDGSVDFGDINPFVELLSGGM
jgi:hypothetical protein